MIAALERDGSVLVSAIVTRMEADDPRLYERYGPRARTRTKEDVAFHLEHLTGALAMEDPDVFRSYKSWLEEMLTARGILIAHIDACWNAIEAELTDRYGDEASTAVTYLRA